MAVLLWGFTGVLGRLITLDATMLVWYRMLLTALIMLGILLFGRGKLGVSIKGFLQLSRIGVLMAAHWVAFYASIKYANASIALVCLSTASIFTSLLEPVFNKSAFRKEELALGTLALAGMYSIYSFQDFYGTGILLGVIAAALSAVFTIFNKQIANEYDSKVMVFYEMGTGFVIITLLLPLVFYYAPDMAFFPRQDKLTSLLDAFPQSLTRQHHDWIWLIIMALFCTVIAQVLALNALKKLSSFTVTLSVNMEPIYGILLAILIYREDKQLSPGFWLGMSLIGVSVVLQTRKLICQNKQKKPIDA